MQGLGFIVVNSKGERPTHCNEVMNRKAAINRRNRRNNLHCQTLTLNPEQRLHLGKIGSVPIEETCLAKGWVGEGFRWAAYLPVAMSPEEGQAIQEALTDRLGDDWGYDTPQ